MEEDTSNQHINYITPQPHVLQVLQALKQASHHLHLHQHPNSPSIKPLLDLHTILSTDPNLSTLPLSHHLAHLDHLLHSLHHPSSHRPFHSFLTRRVITHSISRVAASIESELQSWIDLETLHYLTLLLQRPFSNEDELITLLTQFRDRVLQGFDLELQHLVLKVKLFSSLESVLCDRKCSKRVRDHSALVVAALVRFNKDVFVGQVVMGPTVRALVDMGSVRSMEVLCSLIRSIKSPLVDEIESNGEIPKIIALLNCQEVEMRVLAMDCVMEMGYFGRKEAVEAMVKEGLVKKLVELQRSELGGDLIEEGGGVVEGKRKNREKRFLERHPFASCVARFAVQLEVGEGLRQREKRAFKQEILVRVREGSVSDAEAATTVAEVLWGSSP